MTIQPVTSRILAKLRRPRPLFDVAAEVHELEPASRIKMPPAISLPGEAERITGFTDSEDLHRARLKGGTREEGPTRAYLLPNALIADSTIYAGGSYQVYRSGKKRPILVGRPDHFREAQLCTTFCAQMYFGHFFHDSLVLEELAARQGLTALTFDRTPWLHEPSYRTLFGRHAVSTNYAKVDRLWIVDERTLNEGWISRFEALRLRLRSAVKSRRAKEVFITRGSLFSGRSLANESELAELLERSGFVILQPETEDPATIAAVLKDAHLVVCVAGSAEVHALLAMPAGASLIEIQIAPFFGTIGKILAECIQVRWGYVVAEATSNGFVLEPERLFKTLELVR